MDSLICAEVADWIAALDQPELGEDCERCEPTPQEVKDWACLGEAAALLEDAMRGAGIPLKDAARCVCALQNLATRPDCTKHPDPPQVSDEAVEAVARRLFGELGEEPQQEGPENYRPLARAALQAALPFLRPEGEGR